MRVITPPTTTAASATADEVAAAFVAVAAERSALAARLRSAGRAQEADIIEVAALIATDPALTEPAIAAVRGGENAAAAVSGAAEKQAVVMEGLANRALAERAGDIRQVARAVLDYLGTDGMAVPDGDFILVRPEISPADLIELADAGLVGAVSVAGGASSHAAIIARGLGLPMISGTSPAVLKVAHGQTALLDADAGELTVGVVAGAAGVRRRLQPVVRERRQLRLRGSRPVAAAGRRRGPVHTADGAGITVLCNVASAAETRRGLAAGAAGVGLLRTEIPFTQARAWPTQAQQRAQPAPVLSLLTGRPATVRLLDFSGDKIPPFLAGLPAGATGAAAGPAAAGPAAAGLTALLAHPTALADQLRAILETGRDARLGVLIPMVSSLAEIGQVRDVLAETAAALGLPPAPARDHGGAAGHRGRRREVRRRGRFLLDRDQRPDQRRTGHRPARSGGRPGTGRPPAGAGAGQGGRQGGQGGRDHASPCAATRRPMPGCCRCSSGPGCGRLSVLAAARVPSGSFMGIEWLDSLACKELTERALLASTAAEVWDLVPAL